MRNIWPAFKYSFKATSPRHLNEYFNKSRPWFCFTDEIKIYQTFYWPVICMTEHDSKWEVIDCPCEWWYIKKPFLDHHEDLPWFSYMTSNVSLLIHLNNTLVYILYRRGHRAKEPFFMNCKQGWNPWVKIKLKGESGGIALRNTGERVLVESLLLSKSQYNGEFYVHMMESSYCKQKEIRAYVDSSFPRLWKAKLRRLVSRKWN